MLFKNAIGRYKKPGGVAVISSPTLATLTLSGTLTNGSSSSGTILGATTASTIVSNVTGLSVNSGARTYSWDGTGAAGSTSNGLVETLSGAIGSPKNSSITVAAAAGGLTAPTLTKTSSAGQQLAFTVTFDSSYVGKYFHLQLAGASNFTTPLSGEGAIREVTQPITSDDVINGPTFTILAAQPAGAIYARLYIEDDSPATSAASNVINETVVPAAAVTVVDLGGAPLAFSYSGGAGSGDALSTSALTTLAGDKLLIALYAGYNGAQTSAVVTAKDGSATNIPLTLIDSTATSGNDRLDLYRSTSAVSAGTVMVTVDPSGSVKEALLEVVAIRGAAAGAPTAHTPEIRTIANPDPISVDESLSCPTNGAIISAVGFSSVAPHNYATGTKLGDQTISYRLSVAYRNSAGAIGLTGQSGVPSGPGYSDIHIIATSWGP